MAKITIRASNPHFVVPIMPREPQENIAIPKSFLRNYLIGEKCARKATLRTRKSRKSWKVNLKGLCFEDGWDDFSTAHDLQDGDFLVFKHEGDLTFYVTVFDPSECEKEYPSVNVTNDDQKMEKGATTKKKMKKVSKKSSSNFSFYIFSF
ncbi:hypothetical protein AQUCO_01400277v1 [Aquilegia coerulea]|uniref:TF-B3 domain-containing protein n=1 Tax=Aquilegia coerulea TaxID=218851 RepID=A0A2G5DVH1_AQUCA|nr:hypothetical protein AQUCO_01400277v1 [Aquilegia coerulea]